MKQSRNRGRGSNSRKRSNMPAVICLPQAKPPVALPRKEAESKRAFTLPRMMEPHVLAPSPIETRAAKARNKPAATIQDPELAPLPRNRALIVQPRSLMVAFRQWARKIIMKPKKAALAVDTASARTQVRALRVEVAQLQRSLDQLMAQLK